MHIILLALKMYDQVLGISKVFAAILVVNFN